MFELFDTLQTVFQKKKRIGRGEGSNRGKNSGKGHKGQTKHGGKVRIGFEGGGKSLIRRTPKLRGFKAIDRKDQAKIGLSLINSKFNEGETVSITTLQEKGLINEYVKFVRIFKNVDLKPSVTFEESENIHLTKGVKSLKD